MHINLNNLKQAMTGQIDRNNVISNNLANINTNGYKKDLIFFDAFDKELEKREGQNQITNFEQGQLKETTNPLDLALSGRGFFTVETENGTAYTREGHFKLDSEGVLRTASGNAVLGESGPLVILGKNLKPEKITITQNGEVFSDNEYIDRLTIADFENTSQMRKIGSNMFMAGESTEALNADQVTVHQGFLEESNVNPADEMIQLIEVQRQFESLQKMVRTLDDVFRTASITVGKY